MKEFFPSMSDICAVVGVVAGGIVTILGGADVVLKTLFIIMLLDYLTGMIVALVFHTSTKTTTGTYSSSIGFRGIVRKCVIILMVFVAHRLDVLLDTTVIRNSVCFAYIVNDLASIVENVGLMGVPVPQKIADAIDILKNKEEEG